MPGPSEEADVFRAAAAAYPALTTAALIEALEGAFGRLGFEYFSVFEAVSDGEVHVLRHLLGKPHAAWRQFYAEQRLDRNDVRVRCALTTSEPFFCSELMAGRSDVTAEERRMFRLAEDFGVRESYVLPHRDPENRLFAAVLKGAGGVIDMTCRTAAHILSSTFVLSALRIEAAAIQASRCPGRPRLTARQLECLDWSRRGKSSGDIAKILGLSSRTVDEHIAAACCALAVRTRVQAVSQALTLGLLPYRGAEIATAAQSDP